MTLFVAEWGRRGNLPPRIAGERLTETTPPRPISQRAACPCILRLKTAKRERWSTDDATQASLCVYVCCVWLSARVLSGCLHVPRQPAAQRHLRQPRSGEGPCQMEFHTNGLVISSPAVSGGVVFVASTDGNLYAVDRESGTLKWKFAAKSRITSSPTVSEGLVYFGAYDGN